MRAMTILHFSPLVQRTSYAHSYSMFVYFPVGKAYFTIDTSDNRATPSVVNIDSELLCVGGGYNGADEVIPPLPAVQV